MGLIDISFLERFLNAHKEQIENHLESLRVDFCQVLDVAYLDVRLRVWSFDVDDCLNWKIEYGLIDYDTNHKGFWGYSGLSNDSVISEVAQELIEQVLYDASM